MDDGRLAGEMTLEGLGDTVRKIHDRLEAMDSRMTSMDQKMGAMGEKIGAMDTKIGAMDTKISAMDTKIDEVNTEMREGFTRVDEKLDAAKIRDEDQLSHIKFGLEAREILRDEMHRRFDTADNKLDEQIRLLKDVVRPR